jgi:acetylornithine deacetylase
MAERSRATPEAWLAAHADDLIDLTRKLVSYRSENRPPRGEEGPCQAFVAAYLDGLGLEPDVFRPDEVAGAPEHPAWWPCRDYAGRPNVVARLRGAGGGRSLLFSGHVDVVPAHGDGVHSYWDGEIDDGRLYGRGALDMKGGVACYLHALRCLIECGHPLAGDVIVETTVDEEFGGANGTLACRLRGYNADGAVLAEPTGLAVCHATRGGIQYRLHARGAKGGMDFGGGAEPSALVTIARAASALADSEPARGAPIYQFLLQSGEQLPWGTAEGTPTDGVLEFWAEILPGTTRAMLEEELRSTVARAAADGTPLHWEQRTRFLDALAGDPAAPIVTAMRDALPGRPPPTTAPFACDAFIFSEHSPTPVVVCGPGGDNPHAPDEYVNVADLHTLAAAYVRLAGEWCGPSDRVDAHADGR